MLRFLCVATAFGCLVATPTAAPPIRHYTHEQWQAIKARFTERPRPDYPPRGQVTAIKILKSTGYSELNAEAMKALIRWRAKPGPKWDLDMPIMFAMTRR